MDTSGEGSCQVEEGAYEGPVERNRTGRREKACWETVWRLRRRRMRSWECGPLMGVLLLGDNFKVLKDNLLF